MGFMDKAKKMAEQAQAKLDEAQKQFSSGQQQGQPSGPAVEYDEHGRPIGQSAPPDAPPHGDPLAGAASTPPPAPPQAPTPGVPPTGHGDPLSPPQPPVAQPGVPPTAAEPPAADAPAPDAPPARPEADAADDDRNNPSYEPPKLSSGDPLAG
jgi:hypothetical protein